MTLTQNTLRARQKIVRREKMLIAARNLFVKNGYTKTTMDAIAEQAEVGVATVHTYFSTKEGVFAELARMDMSGLKEEGEALIEQLPADPVEAVHALLDIYVKVQTLISFDVARDFVTGSKKPGPMREVASWITHWQLDQMTRVLEQGRDSNSVSMVLPLSELSLIIIDLMTRFFDRVTDGRNSELEYERFKQRVTLLFADWRK